SKRMLSSFEELCQFFGDDATTTSEEFFGRIDEFIKAFRAEERKIRIAKERAKREKRSIYKKGAKPAPPPKGSGPPPPPFKDMRQEVIGFLSRSRKYREMTPTSASSPREEASTDRSPRRPGHPSPPSSVSPLTPAPTNP